MANLKEKVAYLQGLTKGLNVDTQSPEGKLLVNIVDVLDSFAEELACMSVAQQELENYVETIDDDLTDLEDEVYDVEMIDEDDDLVEIECPVCHEDVTFEADLLDEDDPVEVTCPHCGGIVYDNTLDFADDELDDDDVRSSRHLLHPGV
ncbi:CD1247 N-terminal domain-containing protein [Sporolituus thermophilus]|uniref:MJ0042 family finger-like domain-containing protein n=1 Tax=Sporolituus thermophilus DSM 23256 TaxID=1123285 RepID=A0A1G7IBY3_9FIRM|nr:CD1247 N-terminal domain-containing protein [Sporolituus thermophilus]SDF10267.1 hypothetical protein SAMN05660235_00452 [Sporolituus thermophilus DSM 23256]